MALKFRRNKETAQQAPQAADRQASTEKILNACHEAAVPYLAKELIGLAPSEEQFDNMMSQVQGVQDRCAAFSMDDPKAGAQLAETYLQKMVVQGDWGAAVGALLADASAVASGEEIDHHPPPEQSSSASGGINPFDLYKQENSR